MLPISALIAVAITQVYAFVDPQRPDIAQEFRSAVVGCSPQARQWIRAAFHASATFDQTTMDGGNNGAFEFEGDRLENRGVQETIAFYTSIKRRFGVSFADALTFGGIVAVEACGGPLMAFQPGRVDTMPVAGPEGRLPNPHIASTDIGGIFQSRMGFTLSETVALIGGGHTVAFVSAANTESGQDGFTDQSPTVFDNAIFQVILADQAPMGTVRVPSDLAMARDDRMRPVVEAFAADNSAFLEAFTRAYAKLMNLGAVFEFPQSIDASMQPMAQQATGKSLFNSTSSSKAVTKALQPKVFSGGAKGTSSVKQTPSNAHPLLAPASITAILLGIFI
jgi:hypothetical protein